MHDCNFSKQNSLHSRQNPELAGFPGVKRKRLCHTVTTGGQQRIGNEMKTGL